MRRNRIILLILWISSLIGISFYGGVISYSFFALFTLIPVISLIYILYVHIFFRIFQDPGSRDLTSGKNTDFYFTLQNETPLPFSSIRVTFFSSFSDISGLDDKTEYCLYPHSGIRKKTDLICRYRGEYEVGIKKVIIEDLFRLFTFTYTCPEPFKVTVKPDLIHLDSLKLSETFLNAVRYNSRPVSPDILLREYVPGDDPRLINWKQTGATGNLMVRKMINEEEPGITVIMDSCRYSEKCAEYLPVENKLIETTLALSLFFTEKGESVNVLYRGTALSETVLSLNNFEVLYERMSAFIFRAENTPALLFSEVLYDRRIFKSRSVFLVLHSFDASASSLTSKLSDADIPVFVCLINNDKDALSSLSGLKGAEGIRISTNANLKEVL
ncbi:MAG: DUF58 domain-containing protein [Lachnospiraceae bacterium]|nr:DUF58 domain-containing protein [Lachnospiraceae bacterium]